MTQVHISQPRWCLSVGVCSGRLMKRALVIGQ